MTKKTVTETYYLDTNDLCGPIDEVVARLLRRKAEDGYVAISHRYYDMWDYETTRLETDKEYLARLDREKKELERKQNAKQVALARKRRQYEKLRAEFEGTS